MLGAGPHGSLPSLAVATNPPIDLVLTPLGAEGRPLSDWLTTFHMATVVLDPYTNESSWILKTAVRVLDGFRDSHARVSLTVTADADDTRAFLGPIADRFLVYCDPDRAAVRAYGLGALPAFVFMSVDGNVVASAEGWNSAEWRAVAQEIARWTKWQAPAIPAAGDPGPFRGSAALG
ncbi:MAG: hypothetical protein EA389_00445 [Ilumatobacter sp.]|nr:MAG: hypothetical protein EA389_00445 [Ilumatobacter sp.]